VIGVSGLSNVDSFKNGGGLKWSNGTVSLAPQRNIIALKSHNFYKIRNGKW
jgi:hypothetical protein